MYYLCRTFVRFLMTFFSLILIVVVPIVDMTEVVEVTSDDEFETSDDEFF